MSGAKTTASMLLLAYAALAVVPALGGSPPDWPTFRETDRDANGALTLDEARNVRALGDDFALHDKNSDGRLSRAEFEAAKRADTANDTTENAGRAAGTGARR